MSTSNQVTTVERPAPAVGQTWEDTADGEQFTIVSRNHANRGWNDGDGFWSDESFASGRLRFLGPTVSAPVPATGVAPRAGQRFVDHEGRYFTLTRYDSEMSWAGEWAHGTKASKPLVDFKGWSESLGFVLIGVAPTKLAKTCPVCEWAMDDCSCKSAPAVEPVRPPVHATTRARCNTDGCDDPPAHANVTLCERHIGEAMVFSDGCRLKLDLFPVSSPPGRFQQAHSLVAGGVWSLRDEGSR